MRIVRITREPIVLEPLIREVSRPDCGAVASFLGLVRDHAENRRTASIEYTAYEEMAEKELLKVVRTVADRFGAAAAIVVHRLGHLVVGEASLGVVVASGHRREAVHCMLEIIDEMKKTVPIWKKEFGPDGTTWV